MTKRYKVGDKVKWASQHYGRATEKRGKVVRVVTRDDDPPAIVQNREFPKHKRMFAGFGIQGKLTEQYLVEVVLSPTSKPRLYFPNPSKLEDWPQRA